MVINFFLLVLIFILNSCEWGRDNIASNEKTNNEVTQVINPEPINELPQIDEPVYPPEPPPQLTSYTKTIIVKIANGTSLLTRSEASNSKVYYKKQGDFQYIPCDKNSEDLYTCKITYYEHELEQDINVIFTYDLKLFNIADLEKIHKEETPEIVVSEESTNELKSEGIVKDLGSVLVVEFPEGKSALEENSTQTWSLNIFGCIYE